jgi:acyl transferase domain-containing protein/acyl carrier protein
LEQGLNANDPPQPQQPLAIVGIGCLFPGSVGFAEYWARIAAGVDAVRDVPPTHWQAADYLHPDPKAPDRVYTARGAFLDPVAFNPAAFGIAPNSLEATDSAQLLGLLVAQQALEDAGYSVAPDMPRKIDRNRVSVILGVTGTLELVIPLGARLGHPIWRRALREAGVADAVAEDVVQRIADSYVGWQENSFPGLLGNVVAGRIANRFDLGGTNCVVDAACASSLSAIHLAAMELTTGRADLVLTGGVDTFNDIFMFMCFSKTPALSPTGNARPFDAAGDGTVLGEGIGMVALKRLEDARRDGDRVYAVLRGAGSSSDGKGNAIYAPKSAGQVEALRQAFRVAGVGPDTVELVEAHGTGTRVGDATEVAALTEVYGAAGRQGSWCALGSVKSQIGHTKAAAGVAGLIKAVAALYHKVLPPTIKVERPLEALEPGHSPFYVNTHKRPWLPSPDHPRRAAVSAFGFGGSNFHCVLEEADPRKPAVDDAGDVQVLAFAADDPAGLREQLAAWPAAIGWEEVRGRAARMRWEWRPDAACRLLLAAQRERTDLAALLAGARGELERRGGQSPFRTRDGVFYGAGPAAGRLAVLFPGQGAQYAGMLRDLVCHFPAAHETLAEADRGFRDGPGGPRLVDLIYPHPAFTPEGRAAHEAALRATEVAQPALGAVSLAAWRVLEGFGVRADAFAGHSYGELVALCAAGRLGTAELHRLSRLRGRLMASAGQGQADAGAMLAVRAPVEQIRAVLRDEGIDLVLANKNAPRQTVLSGPSPAIERAAAAFANRQVATLRLAVAAAFHSPAVAAAARPFRDALDAIAFGPGTAPVYTNTMAAAYPDDPAAARDLLANQLARPVEWVAQVERLGADGVRGFLEVGPGAKLTGPVESILSGGEYDALALDASSGQRPGFYDLACVLAWLAARGHAVRLAEWDAGAVACEPAPAAKKPSLVVPLCGANYVKPKPPRAPAALNGSPPAPPSNLPTASGSTPPMTNRPVPVRAPAPAAATPPAPPAADGGALAQALQITRESLTALQKMQEQTAQLHRQFLEGQEAAQRTVAQLVEQQQRLLQGTLGLPVVVASTLPRLEEGSAPVPVAVAPQPSLARRAISPADTSGSGGQVVANGAEQEQVQAVLLGVVAEKTGYPADMLELGMALDADLGIDSIKRVEILSALQERLPQAPAVKPEHLGTLHTLRDIAAFLAGGDGRANGASPLAHPGVDADQPPEGGQVERVLLDVIAEKTGYPVDMLEPGMALDADLGIDSIKRVEILSALQERLPQAPAVKPEHLGTLHTLRDIAAFLAGGDGRAEVAKPTAPAPDQTVESPRPPLAGALRCSVPRAVPLAGASRPPVAAPAGAEVWVTADEPGLAESLVARLTHRGYRPRLAACAELSGLACPENLGGLVVVAPREGCGDAWLRDALLALRNVGPGLRRGGGVLATVSRLDGAFGLAGIDGCRDPVDGGLAGLAKTAGREWPEVACKALDLAADFPSPDAEVDALVEEIFLAGPGEVGLAHGRRVAIECVPQSPPGTVVDPIRPGDVVVVSGGARGVTAEAALALARAFRPTLVLLGRSPLPEPEPDWLAALTDEAEIKQALARRAGNGALKAVGEQCRQILARREVRHNLARLEAAGARAVYRPVDVRDARAVAEVVAEVRRTLGPIRGLVHGAGVLADARIEDKTPEQFDRVYGTKVEGFRALLDAAGDDLRALAVFSSSTARFGRAGQVDYAMANEVLNKLARQEARRRPDCRVVSLNWGPWDGGMVTPALKKLFAREGIGLISLGAGAELLVEQLRRPPGEDVEVVVLADAVSVPAPPAAVNGPALPPALPASFERVLDLADFPVLEAHVLDGRPVVPLALVLEWLAHAALHQNPGLAFHGCDDLRVLHGVTLDGPAPPRVRVGAAKAVKRDGLLVAAAELRGERDGREVLHARADVVLARELPPAPPLRESALLPPCALTPHEAYRRRLLFHGPALQGIECIDGCGEPGVAGFVRAAPSPAEWVRQPLRNRWLGDPLVLDGAFQLMVLWSLECRGVASLPCFVRRYRQWRRAFPAAGTRVAAKVVRAGEHNALADLDFLDDGRLVARVEGYECVLDPNLRRAFDRNQLVAV